MSDNWVGGNIFGATAWFTAGNWSTGKVPVISATGTQSVVISGGTHEPIIPATNNQINVSQTIFDNGKATYTSLAETQIGGEFITLNNGGDLTLQGVAMGIFYGNTAALTGTGKTMTGLHGATSTLASYDHHMSIIATGTADTLTVETVNENFGLISVGTGDTLTIFNTYGNGANAQDLHGLVNYGLISVGSGGHLTISAAGSVGNTIANFYNAGWIEVDGGTLSISSTVFDGANTIAGPGTVDGYIEIGGGGNVILGSTVAAAEEVTFTDSASNTLQISAGTLFSGTVNNFGPGDTIVVTGAGSLTSETIVTVGTTTEMIVNNGSTTTIITLTGSGSLTSDSFVALDGTNGTVIEFASDAHAKNFTFSTSGAGSFETPTNYVGKQSPGDSIHSGETVTIAAGTASVSNATGVIDNGIITVASGAGFIDTNTLTGSGSLVVAGSATLTGGAAVATIIDSGSLVVAGSVSSNISGTGTLAVASGTSATLSGTDSITTLADSGTLTITGTFTDSNPINGTGTLAVATGGKATLTGNTTLGSITDAGTLVLGGTDAVAISIANGAQATIASNFSDSKTITGTGSLTIASGVTVTLAAGSSVANVADLGTLNLAGAMGGSINMEGNDAHTVVDFNTANDAVSLTNFGTTDDIILSSGALNQSTGNGVVLSYNGSVLTVTETNSSGIAVGTDTVTVAGAPGLSTGSFVALESAKGLNIELAPAASTTYDFSASSTGSFEDYNNYQGSIAPGDVLSQNMTVAVVHGTASVSTSGVTDNGLITIAGGTGFIDTGSLSGTGTLAVAAGGSATLTGATSLASITDAGNVTMSGNDAVAIALASGGQLTLSGNFADSAAITGTGALTVNSGVTATLASGSSIASVIDAGTLDLTGSFSGIIDMQGNGAGTVAEFTGGSDVTNGTLNATITNLGFGDTIVLGGADFALNSSSDKLSESYNSSTGVLTVTDSTNGSTLNINLGLAGADPASDLKVSVNSAGDVVVTLCFYPGTALATPAGEIKVEEIVAGDLLMTTKGAMPVRWIGQSHIHTGFADPLRSLPIRICQGALGGGLPVRDLLLSPDHAIAVDGILVQASALVNGSSIIRETQVPEQFTYYHVELDSHELLLAEGVEAESFVDNVDRMHFHNWEDRTAPETAIAEMDLPRAKSTRQLPMAIRRRLALAQLAVA